MYIEKISFRTIEGTELSFDVKVGSGHFKSVLLTFGSRETTDSFCQAIRHTFTGNHSDIFMNSEVQCVDQDGERWALKRSGSRAIVVNKGDLEIRDPSVQRQAFANIFERESWHENNDLSDVIKSYDLSKENTELVARSLDASDSARSEMKKVAEIRSEELSVECADLLSCPQLSNQLLLRKMGSRLEPMYYQISSLVRHKRQFFNDDADITEGAFADRLASLETEVTILAKIDECARPILDPKNNPKLLQQKLAETDANLAKLVATTKSKSLPANPQNIPWSKLIEVRTEMQAHRDLLAHSERLKKIGKVNLDQAFEDQIQALGSIASQSKEVTQELEDCLQMMANEAERARNLANKASRATITGKLAAFLQPDTTVETQQAEAQMAEGVQNCKGRVNDALEKLGKVMTLKVTAEEKFDEYKLWKSENSNEISTRYNQLRQYWQMTCERFKVTPNLSLEGLIKMAVIAGKGAQLQEQAADFRRRITEFSQGIVKLRENLETYRTAIHSSKDSPISTPALVMAETQSVLRGLAHKRNQLEDMSKRKTAYVSYTEQRDAMNARLRELQGAWVESFRVMGLQPIGVGNKNWLSVFQRIHSIRALNEMCHENEMPHAIKQILEESPKSGITLLNWAISESTTTDRESFVSDLANRQIGDLVLVVCSDRQLAESLRTAGASIPNRHKEPSLQKAVAIDPEIVRPAATANPRPLASRAIPNNRQKADKVMAIFEAAKAKNISRQ